ncbi:MAG: hypothetical protein KIT33_04330 [Candidatus Kapabacteria bacterium]|nr:hypothetical protein [Ignavibacteriota bacterium]MCW5884183.1 hypothetical protein [Candidatus Kapabacteria bacterium]
MDRVYFSNNFSAPDIYTNGDYNADVKIEIFSQAYQVYSISEDMRIALFHLLSRKFFMELECLGIVDNLLADDMIFILEDYIEKSGMFSEYFEINYNDLEEEQW